MSESFRSSPPEQQWSGTKGSGNGFQGQVGSNQSSSDDTTGDVGKALLVGVLGGLVSAAGFMIYKRLPDEQKEALHKQVKSQVAQRINEIRSNFNI
jgi:hypothetical protein